MKSTSISSNTHDMSLAELKSREFATMNSDYYECMWHIARNDKIYDKAGKSWIDFTSGVAVTNSGHSNPAIIKAIRKHLDTPLLSTYNFPHRPRLALARQLIRVLHQSTGKKYIPHFLSSGAEAVETAVTVANNTQRGRINIVVSFYNSFHGNTLLTDALSGFTEHTIVTNDDNGGTLHCVKVPYYNRKSTYTSGQFNEDLNVILQKHRLAERDVTSVVIEPYQGRGVFVAHSQFIKEVAEFCRSHDKWLIMDEVQSGFYRTGTRFASERNNITPDILCLGKGLTSSLPMSAIAVRSDRVKYTHDLDIATTHSANPLSCVAAVASIRFLESKKCQERMEQNMPLFTARIEALHTAFPNHICYSEAIGMAGSLHIVNDGELDADKAHRITQRCFRKGLILSVPNGPSGAYLRFTPPLTITKSSVSQAFHILQQVFEEEEGC